MDSPAQRLALENYRSAFHALARVVAALVQGVPVPHIQGSIITFGDNGQVSLSPGSVDWPAFLIGNVGEAIKATVEYKVLREATQASEPLKADLGSAAAVPDEFNQDLFWMRVNSLLNWTLVPTFRYNEQRTDEVLDRLVCELADPRTRYILRAYFRLAGPRVDRDIPFTSGGIIRALTKDERVRLANRLWQMGESGLTASAAVMFETVFELKFQSGEGNILRPPLPRPILDYQTALRLTFGRVAIAFAAVEVDSVMTTSHVTVVVPYRKNLWFGGDEIAILPDVLLTEQSLSRAAAIFDQLGSSLNRDLLATAIRRYNDALERLRLDDALLDCVVGLESVLTADDKSEVLRRLRQRAAVMIGQTAEDRMDVYRKVADIYDARSRIAHGKGPKKPLHELLVDAEDYLGRLLRNILGYEVELNMNLLDASMVRGDSPYARS